MTSKERFDLILNHKSLGSLVVDLASTAVTGIHVLSIESLRKHYGLEKRLVTVIEPFQMLCEVEENLSVIGIDIKDVFGRENMFGIINYGEY
jgi:hypothetical protein